MKAKREQIKKEMKEKAKAEESKKKVATPVPDPNAWSNDQQKQMEKGMKEVPASVPTKERWIKIAEGVDGKTAKECFTRFKELCAKAK